jgi:hypothetical protein
MASTRVPLFQRLPEIYRIKDAELFPPNQLRDYLALVEEAFSSIHENIEALYHDLFIETCDDWVIPYIGDLLGTSHLKGESWTLRADVADTIALRRRKGTIGAIELLAYDLTEWGVHCVELRENLVWNQHLNHQRPDDGGAPPYRDPNPLVKRQTVIRGGTVTLRDPAMLSLLDTPFDPFAHVADVRPPANGSVRYNLPNLAIFLWRLNAYRIRVSKPIAIDDAATGLGLVAPLGVVRFSINPAHRPYLSNTNQQDREPVRLFNTNLVDINEQRRTGIDKLDRAHQAPSISRIDETPGPIPTERLTSGAAAGAPEAYVSVETYDAVSPNLSALDLSDVGFQLHLPEATFSGELFPLPPDQPAKWKIRGENLCRWEAGLNPGLAVGEIAIDPVLGRLLIGSGSAARATALVNNLLLTYTYGAVGPVGAHPVSRPVIEAGAVIRWVTLFPPPPAQVPPGVTVFATIAEALVGVDQTGPPIVVEIQDSMTHVLNLGDPVLTSEKMTEGGNLTLLLNRPLIIRAADDQRPVVELNQPLRFRPIQNFDVNKLSELNVRLEGLYLTRSATFPPNNPAGHDDPLIARAALNTLEIIGCTLDPANYVSVHGDRQPTRTSMELDQSFEFLVAKEESDFNQVPNIILQFTITGPLLIDSVYRLQISNSIVDAGQGVDDNSANKFAITALNNPATGWGPPTVVRGVTIFGRMRVESLEGRGGIWVHALEVLDNQKGCIKFSYFSGEPLDRLPQSHACVKGTEALLRFRSEVFGTPAYGQLALSADERIRKQGPNEDAMGAFGFLLEAHKWSNLQIRFREFMPVGVRPLLIPVT